jgi:hypothetical protein
MPKHILLGRLLTPPSLLGGPPTPHPTHPTHPTPPTCAHRGQPPSMRGCTASKSAPQGSSPQPTMVQGSRGRLLGSVGRDSSCSRI